MVHLEESVRILAPIDRCFDLARSVEVHLLGNVHFGEQAVASAGVTSGLVALGETVTWRAKHFGVWFTLRSEITAMDAPLHFRDEMRQGPFRFMRHDHYFQPLPGDATDMTDIFRFAAPLPLLGLLAEACVLRRYMRRLLQERNLVIKQLAESSEWRNYLPSAR